MGNFTIFQMFENPRRGRQARNFTTNVQKILDLKSSSEQIFFRKLSLGAPGNCLQSSVIYQATVKRNDNNTSETYIGLTKNAFKTRQSNHTASFRHTKHRNSTELSKHVWSLKDSNIDYSISLRIISSSSSYDSSSKRCNLSLKEEFLIICLPIYYHLTNVTNVYLLAATEIKRCCVTTKHLNLNFPQQCNLKVYSQWL